MTCEATLAFTDTTEYALFQSVTTDTPRKIRIRIQGSAIAGASGSQKQQLDVDWYGTWATAPFQEQDGIWTVRLGGESLYDATLAGDWRVNVITDAAMT